MRKEIFKDIPGYNGLYQISNNGLVRRLPGVLQRKDGSRFRVAGWVNDGFYSTSKHKFVVLSKNGIKKTHLVHRLVAQVFIPNHHNKPVVNHINGVRIDNRVENLEWCTQSENVLDAYKRGYKVSKETRLKLSEAQKKRVYDESWGRAISLRSKGENSHRSIPIIDLNTNKEYVSLKDYAEKNNLNYHTTKGHWRSGKLSNIVRKIAKQPA